MRAPLSLFLFLVPAMLNADSMPLTFTSGEQQVSLIELYTSEGCSSCPPADRFVRSLGKQDGLFSAFIPLAFHVDYWDYIGWADPYASPAFSERQRRYAQLQDVAYTHPAFLSTAMSGADFSSAIETGGIPCHRKRWALCLLPTSTRPCRPHSTAPFPMTHA